MRAACRPSRELRRVKRNLCIAWRIAKQKPAAPLVMILAHVNHAVAEHGKSGRAGKRVNCILRRIKRVVSARTALPPDVPAEKPIMPTRSIPRSAHSFRTERIARCASGTAAPGALLAQHGIPVQRPLCRSYSATATSSPSHTLRARCMRRPRTPQWLFWRRRRNTE